MASGSPHRALRAGRGGTVFRRALSEHRLVLGGWFAGLGLYCAAMLAVFPTIHGNRAFAKLVESYPDAFRSMFAVADFTTGPGYLRGEIFSLMGPILVVLLALLWGSDLTAGEEERHTIDLLLANPVSRRRVVGEKWAAMAVGVTAVTSVFAIVPLAGNPIVHLGVGVARLLGVVVATAFTALLFGTLALAVAAATGRRGLARGVAAALAVASYLVSSLADLVSFLRPVRPLSPWYQAIGVDPLTHGFSWRLLIVVGLTAVLVAVSLATFERRDLAVS